MLKGMSDLTEALDAVIETENMDYYLPACMARDRILAAIEAAGYAIEPGWQSVETAPHGEFVLLGWAENDEWKCEVAAARWGWAIAGTGNRSWHGQATHWRPLPAAPGAKP